MTKKKLSRGWVEGSARQLLRQTREEETIVEIRLQLSDEVRSKRLARGMTQQELATRIESTQPRVARLEHGVASFEMMVLALLALGVSRKEIGRIVAAA
jgi:ribosome-binding protein aMBF1 (putative translation factor)